MKDTQFRIQDVFGDILRKEVVSPEQRTKLIKFLAKLMQIF